MDRAHGERKVGAASLTELEPSVHGAEPVPGRSTLSESRGRPLPDAQRAKFESSLGADLSRVRVHTDHAAGAAAAFVGARAFAVRSDIAFGPGAYKPGTPAGDKLLAHEVAHTVQQSGASNTGALATTRPGDTVEREADVAA